MSLCHVTKRVRVSYGGKATRANKTGSTYSATRVFRQQRQENSRCHEQKRPPEDLYLEDKFASSGRALTLQILSVQRRIPCTRDASPVDVRAEPQVCSRRRNTFGRCHRRVHSVCGQSTGLPLFRTARVYILYPVDRVCRSDGLTYFRSHR
jgi:hypothetical protein